jgi:hypothetical protein
MPLLVFFQAFSMTHRIPPGAPDFLVPNMSVTIRKREIGFDRKCLRPMVDSTVRTVHDLIER